MWQFSNAPQHVYLFKVFTCFKAIFTSDHYLMRNSHVLNIPMIIILFAVLH